MAKSKNPTAPGEGERRAQRGYVRQYESSAAAIYAALERDDLIWVGLADRSAGIADDVVLGLSARIVGHQFKTSKYPSSFRLQTLLFGADELLLSLVSAWRLLSTSFPNEIVEIRFVTNDYPSTGDALVNGADGHSAAFLRELELHSDRTLAEWRSSRWATFVNALAASSGLDDPAFDKFLRGLRIFSGSAANFAQLHKLSPDAARLSGEIAKLLPLLVADARDKDRWSRAELLEQLGWRDSFALRRLHQFPVGAHVQRNAETERQLRNAIKSAVSGYIALVGSPGSGKSTLLQSSLITDPTVLIVRYLAFVPGEGQGIGRGEAEDFLDDVNAQLKQSGLTGLRFRDTTLQERREQFGSLLRQAGEWFQNRGVRTIVVVDGLDHVPREERPERSFLAELPLPTSVPAGMLIVLGTQRVDLADLKPAVQEQASLESRRVVVAPLSREAVYRMTNALGLPLDLSRERIFELCHGQPLVTRYLIEALRDADGQRREALLAGEFTFEGDIEAVYTSAWRYIKDDVEASDVMGYIAHAEGPIQPELLARAVSEAAVERALASTRHLLNRGPKGWTVFHNSFRLFILSKPRLRFGAPDPEYSPAVYRRLAELARVANTESAQRWLELRYLARAQLHADVLALAQPARFRLQLADGRSAADILVDIKLAFAATKTSGDATDVFRLLLARDEIERRATALGYASGIVDAMLAVGDLDGAQSYSEAHSKGGYRVVDALLKAGDVDRARTLFDRIEPLGQLLGDTEGRLDLYQRQDTLRQWANRVFHFRETDQIDEAIERLSNATRHDGDEATIADWLRFEVARAVMRSRPDSDPHEAAYQLKLPAAALPHLLIVGALHAYRQGTRDIACKLISQVMAHEYFLNTENRQRRHLALAAVDLGDAAAARATFAKLEPPAIATIDGETGKGAPEAATRAIIEHAELATALGERIAEVAPSTKAVLQPLQHHANTAGTFIGRARAGNPPSMEEITRATREALTYFARVKATGPDDFYAANYHVVAAAPVIARALVHAAALCGEAELAGVVSEVDRSFQDLVGNGKRVHLRREVAIEIYRWDGDRDGANRRLSPLVSQLREDTPEMQVEELSALAVAFARIGEDGRARELLRQLHDESLGYALAPKKDPQYALWRDLLLQANAADPAHRRERVELMVRQLHGMMQTEGRSAAYRIAADVLTEATMIDAATGFAAARTMAACAILGWDAIANALLVGIVRRRPDLASPCIATWMSLVLPYYSESRHRSDKVGEFVSAGIAAASERELPTLVDALRAAIEAESQVGPRAALLEHLVNAAAARGVKSTQLHDALARWRDEAPPERDTSTPGRHDDVPSLAALEKRFLDEEGEPDYDGANAYERLVVDADVHAALGVFDRWPAIQKDIGARFALVERALRAGEAAIARRVVEQYERQTDKEASWSHWAGAGKLQYFRARLKLDGAVVNKEAYSDLVSDLAAGRVDALSILLYFDEVFPTITASPNWPAMWECLAEQLNKTREHALGKPFEVAADPRTDEDLIVSLYGWAMSLSLFELTRHARIGALRLVSTERGAAIFRSLALRLLRGDGDEPVEALQLLSLDTTNTSASGLGDSIAALVDHPDYAVAVLAARLSRRWGMPVTMSHADLAGFYEIHIEEEADDFERPTLINPTSGSMLVEDPLGWTFAFENLVRSLSKNGVSIAHIRYRCRMFIEDWGGLAAHGQPATDKLLADLARLDMRITFSRPHMVVAMRALRYVAGEMRRAGLIQPRQEPWLLHKMGRPANALPVVSPAARPHYLRRPAADRGSLLDEEQRWLQDVDNDVRPLVSGRGMIIAEITRFHRRHIRRKFTLERIRTPLVDVGSGTDLESWIEKLPRAIWVEEILPLADHPAPTIVSRFLQSVGPEIPEDMLVICPIWLERLSWRQHPDNWLVYLDRTGHVVANVVWWRDGGPIDVEQDAFWGEGVVVAVTPNGLAQIESAIGPFKVHVHARRTAPAKYDGKEIADVRASAVE